MKITNIKLVTTFGFALDKLCAVKSNSKAAYNIAKTTRNANKEAEDFNAAKKQILESRCVKDKDDKPVIVDKRYTFATPEIEREVNDLVEELNNTEIDLTVFPVRISDFENAQIEPAIFVSLGDFVQDDTMVAV